MNRRKSIFDYLPQSEKVAEETDESNDSDNSKSENEDTINKSKLSNRSVDRRSFESTGKSKITFLNLYTG